MLSMLKVLVLAACVAFVVGDAHDPCESDEAAACSVCACLLTGDCTEEQTTFCTDPVEMTVCKYTRTRTLTDEHAHAFNVCRVPVVYIALGDNGGPHVNFFQTVFLKT